MKAAVGSGIQPTSMEIMRYCLVNGAYARYGARRVAHLFDGLYARYHTCIHRLIRFRRTGKRNEIFLATKFGSTPNGPNGTAEYARESIDKSLKRLGLDYVDLYYLHRYVNLYNIWIQLSAFIYPYIQSRCQNAH